MEELFVSPEDILDQFQEDIEGFQQTKGFQELVSYLRNNGPDSYLNVQAQLSRDPKNGFKMQVLDAAAEVAGVIAARKHVA